jgi:hypothetical protein
VIALSRAYVALMMRVVGHGLAATSRVDPVLRRELAVLPAGFQIQMIVLPAGPGMVVQAHGDGTLSRVREPKARPDLSIRFKHLSHAFLVLTFQEGTARAFANNRMVADGDVAIATRLVRCLNRLESLILPAVLARRAVKRYTPMRLREKLPLAARTYGRMLLQVLTGA